MTNLITARLQYDMRSRYITLKELDEAIQPSNSFILLPYQQDANIQYCLMCFRYKTGKGKDRKFYIIRSICIEAVGRPYKFNNLKSAVEFYNSKLAYVSSWANTNHHPVHLKEE